ncbi:hypothetical protein A0H81_05491 [Grifola frondosa]|uniref:Gylcosyl hydrolase 115 C-terminal domain-containing protein n=1 Tax=Grifola frondosa TaxID=5627 RepID=A0A1C7MDB2_GRIFR|nr:hypothetical protein A0H81_05491 [Grifola frondosa]
MASWSFWFDLVVLSSLIIADRVCAIGQSNCVAFKSSSATFSVVSNGKAAPVFLSADEWPGVQRAAVDFASDIQQVTGITPALLNVSSSSSFGSSSNVIIVGTLGKSSLIDEVVNRTGLDVSSIQGQWEAFMAKEVANPLPGVQSATIWRLPVVLCELQVGRCPDYETFRTLCNLVGMFAWVTHSTISRHLSQRRAAALQNWAMEKFTNGTGAALTGSPFNHFSTRKCLNSYFELRRITYGQRNGAVAFSQRSAFGIDDSQDQPLADWWGIVMGTSHEEPIMRSTPVEWDLFGSGPWDYGVNAQNIYNFWVEGANRSKTFENIYTIGMRGAGDLPLSEGQDIQLLEQIVSDQRQLLTDVLNVSDITTVRQMWTLYEEVLGFYEDGMRVPDDVILVWADDTWGNIRRYPLVSERNRTGGSGIYYHLDLVGPPRDYKWITSSQISKTYEQMSAAVARNASRVWVLNVGDLKPYELHTEFFITYGWDASLWNRNNLDTFVSSWAQREFDISIQDATEVADIIANVTRWNARRKPELLNSTTYSLTNYREAENVLAGWESLSNASTRIYNSLSSSMQPAFFQLVQHPVQASYTLANMWISAGINNLRASQARLSANNYATQVEDLFLQDYDLEVDYHTLLNGKWDHMMDQTHVMYYYWQQPMANTMPFITMVQPKKQALPGAMRIAIEGSAGAWPGDNMYDCEQGYSCPNPSVSIDPFVPAGNRFFDVGAGGPTPFTFTATSNASWLKLSPAKGSISPSSPEQRVFASVDWSQVTGVESAILTFAANVQDQPPMSQVINFVANHTVVPSGFKGFVEGDGTVSIEAAHAARNTSVDGLTWVELPGIGRTLSGITPWPRGGDDRNFTAGTGPSIEYDFYIFNTQNQTGNIPPLAIAMQIDSGALQTNYFIPPAIPGEYPPEWSGNDGWVANSIVTVPMDFDVPPGAHVLKVNGSH